MSRRFARHAVEGVKQSFAPRMDRIVLRQQFERADDARPLEWAEHDVVGIVRLFAAEIGLRLQGQPHRLPRAATTSSSGLPKRASRVFRKYTASTGFRFPGISATISGNMPPTTVTSPHQFNIRPMARPPSPPNSDGRSG